MRQLIVNADDFALTPGVSNGIIEAHKNGIVTSTTLMANSPHFEKAVILLKNTPSLETGIHLNLTWGKPVLPCDSVPSLIDKNGTFFKKPHLLPDRINPEEMQSELEAQINKAISYKIQVTHLDSHHHLHTARPEFFNLFMQIAAKYSLPLRTLESSQRKTVIANNIPTPDNFIGTFFGRENIKPDFLYSLIENLPDGISELMCHPGIPDDTLNQESSYTVERKLELDLLTAPSLKNQLNRCDIQLVNYNILFAAK